MKTKRLICAAMIAMSCFTGTVAAQNIDRRGPNVMPAPQQNGNYPNNTNTYDRAEAQPRRGANAPHADRSPAPAESAAEDRSGPNSTGDSFGLPAESRRGNDRHSDAIPGCDRCVAI